MNREDLLAPCGLYCGVCGILIAHRDDNDKFKQRLSTVYGCSPEEIACEGCLSSEPFLYCRSCPIKSCNQDKGFEGCHECSDFPCGLIDNFPLPVGKKVILRAVRTRRELGTDRWVEEEEKRYICPSCSSALFRGAKRCRSCGEPVDCD